VHDLPEMDNLGVVEKRPSIVIQSHDGVILANYGDLYGEYLTYDDFPKYLIDALRATEDRRFFDHIGIDFIGLARAFYRNWQAGYIVEGGSTITQQLAKNLFLSPERTIKRKVQEVFLALWLEQKFTKEQILTLYLNRVYLGAGTYGVDAAANRYFQKSARDLSLSESAMIVGLLKAPSRYSPTNNIERSRARAEQVLKNMEAAGFITPELVELGMTFPAQLVTYRTGSLGSYYFADWIMERLPNYIGRIDRDLVITTTLDTTLQRTGEEAIEQTLRDHGEESRVDQGALVSLSADGAIRAMVGGRNYRKSQFNRVTQAKRQPGSSFKLFPYLAALEEGVDPKSLWMDEPIRIEERGMEKPWEPKNYGHQYLAKCLWPMRWRCRSIPLPYKSPKASVGIK
jgi:penicillin-binding protein 1A